jgi:hypothetical protein
MTRSPFADDHRVLLALDNYRLAQAEFARLSHSLLRKLAERAGDGSIPAEVPQSLMQFLEPDDFGATIDGAVAVLRIDFIPLSP